MNFFKNLFYSSSKERNECFADIRIILIGFKNKYQEFKCLPTYGLDNIIDELKDNSESNWKCINEFLRYTKSWKVDAGFALSLAINHALQTNLLHQIKAPYSSFIADITNLQAKIIDISQKFSFRDKIKYNLEDF